VLKIIHPLLIHAGNIQDQNQAGLPRCRSRARCNPCRQSNIYCTSNAYGRLRPWRCILRYFQSWRLKTKKYLWSLATASSIISFYTSLWTRRSYTLFSHLLLELLAHVYSGGNRYPDQDKTERQLRIHVVGTLVDWLLFDIPKHQTIREIDANPAFPCPILKLPIARKEQKCFNVVKRRIQRSCFAACFEFQVPIVVETQAQASRGTNNPTAWVFTVRWVNQKVCLFTIAFLSFENLKSRSLQYCRVLYIEPIIGTGIDLPYRDRKRVVSTLCIMEGFQGGSHSRY